MARSIKKGFFVDYHLLEKIEKAAKAGAKKPIQTWSRRSTITTDFVGHTFSVHTGSDPPRTPAEGARGDNPRKKIYPPPPCSAVSSRPVCSRSSRPRRFRRR